MRLQMWKLLVLPLVLQLEDGRVPEEEKAENLLDL